MRCLTIDVGNSSTGIGVYDGETVSQVKHVPGGILRAPAACAAAVRRAARRGLDGVALGSVAPRANAAWRRLVRRETGCEALMVDATLKLDVTIDYPHPLQIGADRLADACGGVRRYGAPLIVADFGTALTFDVILEDRTYIGGVIAPGLPAMTEYLYARTALLPRVDLSGPCPMVGRSTQQAMRIGAQIGYRGMAREIVNHLREALRRDFKLVATGGHAGWALGESGMPFVMDPDLTLFGLGCVFERNAKEGAE